MQEQRGFFLLFNFFCFFSSLAELEQITEQRKGDVEGEFSCSSCNFKFLFAPGALRAERELHESSTRPSESTSAWSFLGFVLIEATKLAVWSSPVSAWLGARSQRPHRPCAAG